MACWCVNSWTHFILMPPDDMVWTHPFTSFSAHQMACCCVNSSIYFTLRTPDGMLVCEHILYVTLRTPFWSWHLVVHKLRECNTHFTLWTGQAGICQIMWYCGCRELVMNSKQSIYWTMCRFKPHFHVYLYIYLCISIWIKTGWNLIRCFHS